MKAITILYFAALCLILAVALSTRVFAHSWYSTKCCSGRDCKEAPFGVVTPSKDGWRVHLDPGQHPMAPGGFDEVVPYDDPRIQKSLDANFHICIAPEGTYSGMTGQSTEKMPARLLCLYVGELQG